MSDATFLGERRKPHPHLGTKPGVPFESERLYRTLGDVAPGFLWLAHATGRFLYVNKTWEDYTGSTLEQLNEGGWEQFNHPSELAQVQALWSQAAERVEQFEMELRYRRHDGEYRWMLARVVPMRTA